MTQGGPLAVYVHWPFCVAKCPYCDFNSHVAEALDEGRWRTALVRELEHFAVETEGRRVGSVFFGGGTPSLMQPETVAAVIEAVERLWGLEEGAEITLEANPTTAESGRFQAFHEAKVNRLSIGVQSLDDGALGFLGRVHSAAEAREAVSMAARIFQNHSLDLIYGLPGQTPGDWRAALEEALVIAGPHLSAYQLTVEPGTPFHRDGVAEAEEERAVALYEATQEVLEAAGYVGYEVSNHARPGFDCRHNLHVWRGSDYAGVGPGAHGRLTGGGGTDALHQIRDPARWLAAVEQAGHGSAGRRTLTETERREERVLLGLRLAEGLPPELAGLLPQARLTPLIDEGYLLEDKGRLRATERGRLCLNAVLSALLT